MILAPATLPLTPPSNVTLYVAFFKATQKWGKEGAFEKA